MQDRGWDEGVVLCLMCGSEESVAAECQELTADAGQST